MAAKKASVLSKRDWQDVREKLSGTYPDATDGILFCLHKLQQNKTVTIPEFREEAKRVGITIGGRALHSARVLLGYATATTKNKKRVASPASRVASPASRVPGRGPGRPRKVATDASSPIEGMIEALRSNQREVEVLRSTLAKIRDLIDRID